MTDGSCIIFVNFILPGSLNQMARMTDVPSALVSSSLHNQDEYQSNFEQSELSQTHHDLGMLGQGSQKCVSASLEYLGIQSPEQLKFGKQDSLALVWQLGVLLYRTAFNDNHPFMSCVSN